MDWSLTLHSILATLTSALIAFYGVTHHQFPVEKLVDLISSGDFQNASVLWNKMIFNENGNYEAALNKTDILEQIFSKSFEKSENSSTKLDKLARFVHLSLDKSSKPGGYYQLYEVMKAKQFVFSGSGVFQLAKYAMDDNVQYQKIPVGKNNNVNLLGVLPSPVWSVLQGNNVMLRNSVTRSYLYVNAEGQMLAWNTKLTNERQAIFKFLQNQPINSSADSDNFATFEMTYGNTRLSVAKNNTSLFTISKQTENPDLVTSWTLELISPTTLRIFALIGDQKGAVVAETGTMQDDPRSQVYLQFGQVGPESAWEVVRY